MVKSYTDYIISGSNTEYGYSAAITQPTDTTKNGKEVSVVCLEYRCNGPSMDPNKDYANANQMTFLTVVPLTSKCVFQSLDPGLQSKQSTCTSQLLRRKPSVCLISLEVLLAYIKALTDQCSENVMRAAVGHQV